MAYDFPNSPTVGQTVTTNGITRRWDGTVWSIIATTIQGVTGATGLQGIQGTQGVLGTQGTQGTNGLQGTQGTEGVQGVAGSGSDATITGLLFGGM